jgi:hypothetical protein
MFDYNNPPSVMVDFFLHIVFCFKLLGYAIALWAIVALFHFIVVEIVIKNFNKDFYQQILDYRKEHNLQ